MFDLSMVVYVLALLVFAGLVSRFFPTAPVFDTDFGLGPISCLFVLACFLTPALGAYLLPDFLRTSLFPFTRLDWIERLAQILAPMLALYITVRGIIIWASLALLAGIGWLVILTFRYVFGG